MIPTERLAPLSIISSVGGKCQSGRAGDSVGGANGMRALFKEKFNISVIFLLPAVTVNSWKLLEKRYYWQDRQEVRLLLQLIGQSVD